MSGCGLDLGLSGCGLDLGLPGCGLDLGLSGCGRERIGRMTSVAGVGIGLRRPLYDSLVATERKLDFLELIPENFVSIGGWRRRMLNGVRGRWPLLVHGVSLSIGGPDPLNLEYISGLKALLDEIDAPFYTDHLCYASAHGIQFHDLLPLPFTDEAVHWVAGRTRELANRIERPVLLENISYYAEMPGSALSEGEFVRGVLEEADAGLLLDVNNVYVNARNHGRDPRQALLDLPLERTRQIHLAGHQVEGDILLDDHGSAVIEPVWELFRLAVERTGAVPTLIEWDNNIPPLDRVIDEADSARKILEETGA